MSWQPAESPQPGDSRACDAIDMVIVPRARDLGGFEVRRALPSARRQMVGPFIFWDQMGPAEFLLGEGLDVRPHPHIGLATVTYLFRGEVVHRDSLGTAIAIRPGALNLMTAGRGVAHSERTSQKARVAGANFSASRPGLHYRAVTKRASPALSITGKRTSPSLPTGGRQRGLSPERRLGPAPRSRPRWQ